jgi:hypothetical protein
MTTTSTSRNGTFPNDARSAAALYLARGLALIGMPPRSKDPGYPEWQRMRPSAADLDQHFPAGQDRNIGVLNGSPSNGIADVDLDCPEAIHAAELLPSTGMIFGRASAPRSHRYYRTTPTLDTAALTFKDIDGLMLLELRGSGGLTVFPPSLHRETGEPIVWDRFDDPAEVSLADIRRAVSEVAAAALVARHWPAEGSRDAAALALTGALLRGGWQERRVGPFVYAVACAACDDEPRMRAEKARGTAAKLTDGKDVTGWPRLAELLGEQGAAVVRRVREWLGLVTTKHTGHKGKTAAPSARPRSIPPYRPFPVDSLPDPLRDYVQHGAAALRCDPSYLALPCISATAALIGNTRTIRLKRGWEEPCLFWTAIVGDSGTLKSPAYRTSINYLFRKQHLLIEQHKKDMEEYTSAVQQRKEAKQAHKQGKGEPPGDEPDKPTLRRIVCADTTIEKLAEILDDNPRGILLARDELAGWLGSFTRYKSGKGATDLPNWLEIFQAGTIMVDRKTGERQTLYVHRATASITGGIQPGVLTRALTPEFMDAGLAARLLMAMPPKLAKVWSELEVPLTVEKVYYDLLDTLLTLDFDTKDGEKVPHALRLSAEGKRAWVAFYNAWAQEQAAVEGELAAAFSKLEGYAARFALLHHVVTRLHRREDDTADVEAESIDAGVSLSRWCADEDRRIYSTLSESDDERDSRRLVEYIQTRGGGTTARGLQKSNSRKYPTSEQANAALDELVEMGLGHWKEPLTSPRGGQPARSFFLLPTPDTTDTTGAGPDDDTADEPLAAPDTTADSTPANPYFPAESGGSVGSVGCRTGETTEAHGTVEPDARTNGSVGRDGVVSGAPGPCPFQGRATGGVASSPPAEYMLVTDPAGLAMIQAALDNTTLVGLDTETTGLDPQGDRVRLLTLATDTIDGGTFTYLVDCFAVDPPRCGRRWRRRSLFSTTPSSTWRSLLVWASPRPPGSPIPCCSPACSTQAPGRTTALPIAFVGSLGRSCRRRCSVRTGPARSPTSSWPMPPGTRRYFALCWRRC